jgi:predicted  nucleic acid-binding Zn-ribbon protein
LRKHLQAQEGVDELNQRIEALKQKKMSLKNKEIELKLKIDAIDKRNSRLRSTIEAEQKMQLDAMLHISKEVNEFLEIIKENPSSPKSPAKP